MSFTNDVIDAASSTAHVRDVHYDNRSATVVLGNPEPGGNRIAVKRGTYKRSERLSDKVTVCRS